MSSLPDDDSLLVATAPFVAIILHRCDAQFPRTCTACGRHFATFSDFARMTTPQGVPLQYDDSPEDPFGLLVMSNCPCGTTLALRWEEGPGPSRAALRHALQEDAERAGVSVAAIEAALRREVRRRASGA